jgi:putative MATE family efflux protein
MGIAISSQYSVAKLYNDPLLKTSTSMVANKKGKELSASVTISIAIASIIGFAQCLIYVFFAGSILSAMSVPATSNMRQPALSYLRWRSLGVPAATILLVSNGIFRGRGDTKTPLYCTTLGNLINILLDPILIFNLKMGCAGAGAATAISQWVTVFPLLYFLNKSIPLRLSWEDRKELIQALKSYISAGGLVFIRTLGKVGAYTVTSAAAAKLGAVSMAAYSLTFNLGFATSQLCESISIAVQVLLARDMPIDNQRKQIAARHVIQRALILGLLVSSGLSVFTHFNLRNVLAKLTTSVDVQKTAAAIMPAVLLTQLIKGLTYSTGGIILGGLDWTWSTAGMLLASAVCVGLTRALPLTLTNIWLALAAFMGVQVIFSLLRVASSRGPWEGLIRKFSNDNTGEDTGSENIVKSAAM